MKWALCNRQHVRRCFFRNKKKNVKLLAATWCQILNAAKQKQFLGPAQVKEKGQTGFGLWWNKASCWPHARRLSGPNWFLKTCDPLDIRGHFSRNNPPDTHTRRLVHTPAVSSNDSTVAMRSHRYLAGSVVTSTEKTQIICVLCWLIWLVFWKKNMGEILAENMVPAP